MTPTQRNLLVNLTSQGLALALGLVCLPRVAELVGVEAYGLVGLLWTVQSVAVLLDFGWGVAASRELARLSGEIDDAGRMRAIVGALGRRYLWAALAVGAVSWFMGPWLGRAWLSPRELSADEVGRALRWIGIIVALQIPVTFFSSCALGLQRVVPLSVIRSLAVIVNYPVAIFLLTLGTPSITRFLAIQTIVVAMQLAATYGLLHLTLARARTSVAHTTVDWVSMRRFATDVFGISLTGLLIAQSDKFLLSKLLTLEQFGYYSLAATVSAGLLSLGQPVFFVVLPRLTQLVGSRQPDALQLLYHQASQFLSVLVIPVGLTLAVFPDGALLAWTGKADVVAHTADILRWLAIGSTLIALNNVAYALQLAHGWTRLPLIANSLAVFTVLPLMGLLASRYGGAGAAMAWAALGAGYVFVSIPMMYRKLLPGAGGKWLRDDLLCPFLPVFASTVAIRLCLPTATRSQAVLALIVALAAGYGGAFACTRTTRQWVWDLLKSRTSPRNLRA